MKELLIKLKIEYFLLKPNTEMKTSDSTLENNYVAQTLSGFICSNIVERNNSSLNSRSCDTTYQMLIAKDNEITLH